MDWLATVLVVCFFPEMSATGLSTISVAVDAVAGFLA
jgi:hypothetical protein